MSIRINLEIGHEASIRTKRTPEGFTHDWEVFVRGCDGANIQYFVEKVVFNLHDTFPKPRRGNISFLHFYLINFYYLLIGSGIINDNVN